MCLVQTEGESAPLKFSQVFHLMPVNNSFVVTNGEQPACHPPWCESAGRVTQQQPAVPTNLFKSAACRRAAPSTALV